MVRLVEVPVNTFAPWNNPPIAQGLMGPGGTGSVFRYVDLRPWGQEARGCSSESGMRNPRETGAPNRCCHQQTGPYPHPLRPSPGLARRACEIVDHHLPRRRAGTGEHGGQDADAGRFRAGWRRLHRRRLRCALGDGRRLRGQGAIHPGDLPAQLPVGAWSTRPREPAPDHWDLRDLGLAKEGARHTAIPAATPCWPSPPAC